MFFTPDLTVIQTMNPRREFHHWCPQSQDFASTSHLLSAVLRGWQVNSHIIQRTFALRGGRRTHVYYIELRRNRAYMTMPVIENPALIRLISMNPDFSISGYHEHVSSVAAVQRQRTRGMAG